MGIFSFLAKSRELGKRGQNTKISRSEIEEYLDGTERCPTGGSQEAAFLFKRNNKVIISIEEMKKNVVSPFIEMIWEIVSDPQTDHIVSWNPNGTSFCITNSQIFADEILTTSFKHGNISSFVRQLNMYNFHKNKANVKELEFFHKLFRRDARLLMIGIKRKPSEADQREGEKLLRSFLLSSQPTLNYPPSDVAQEKNLDESVSTPPMSTDFPFMPFNFNYTPLIRKFSSTFTSPESEALKIQPSQTNNFKLKQTKNIILRDNIQRLNERVPENGSPFSYIQRNQTNNLGHNFYNFDLKFQPETSYFQSTSFNERKVHSSHLPSYHSCSGLHNIKNNFKNLWNIREEDEIYSKGNIENSCHNIRQQETSCRKIENIILICRPEDY